MAITSLSSPRVIYTNGSVQELERLTFDGKDFDERWVQDQIQNNPSILPVSEFDPAYEKLINIGYEVELNAGYIDNLCVTPNGSLVVVETKLWRNPEARRQVVAQIIDYAKELTTWNYENFNEAAKEYSKSIYKKESSLVDLVKKEAHDFNERLFHDNLLRNANKGKFLLLIVGDGIREGAEEMVEFLQNFATLQFTLGLVELRVYRLGKEEILIIPDVLLKTKEIQRAVITVNGKDIHSVNVKVDASLEIEAQKKLQSALSETTFFKILEENVGANTAIFAKKLQENYMKRGFAIKWNPRGFSVQAKDTDLKRPYTIFSLSCTGRLLFYPEVLQRAGVAESYINRFTKAVGQLFPDTDLESDDPLLSDLEHQPEKYRKFSALVDEAKKLLIRSQMAD